MFSSPHEIQAVAKHRQHKNNDDPEGIERRCVINHNKYHCNTDDFHQQIGPRCIIVHQPYQQKHRYNLKNNRYQYNHYP